jgi:hypothetical protein
VKDKVGGQSGKDKVGREQSLLTSAATNFESAVHKNLYSVHHLLEYFAHLWRELGHLTRPTNRLN